MTVAEAAAGAGAPPPRPLSRVIAEIAASPAERISLGEIAAALWDRGFAPLMALCAAPNVLPIMPGSSFIFGIPLILLSFQLMLGWPRVWLPGRLNRRTMDMAAFRRLAERAAPWLERTERLARPRYWPASRRAAERLAGAVSLLMAVLLFLPIPFANTMPALSIIFVALGISERDGLWLGAGLATAIVSLLIVAGIYVAGAAALAAIL
ncbi:MAG: exopolysaccharide biosynthesis protein [Pikeienuella sp.]|uniref:exopolysaccharide biosynthesis protein n=1 Tax=Pikeienuella sp. TaxID=2831957 RepID=UPI003918E2FE